VGRCWRKTKLPLLEVGKLGIVWQNLMIPEWPKTFLAFTVAVHFPWSCQDVFSFRTQLKKGSARPSCGTSLSPRQRDRICSRNSCTLAA